MSFVLYPSSLTTMFSNDEKQEFKSCQQNLQEAVNLIIRKI